MPTSVMIVAGEASGDLYGAWLARAMLEVDPSARIFGVGGWRMAEAGVDLAYRCEDLACMGVVETLGNLSRIRAALKGCSRLLDCRRPDLLIPIDYPGFNLRLAERARLRGVPVLYYIAPKVWAWGGWRIKKIARSVSKLVVILPFEEGLYKPYPIDVQYLGHPLVDIVRPGVSPAQFRDEIGIRPDERVIGLLPGSRIQEVGRILPSMLRAVRDIGSAAGRLRAVVGSVADVDQGLYRRILSEEGCNAAIVEGRTYDLMASSDVLLVASGTATLEAAILGTPMVVLYRMASLSYLLARMVVSLPFVALPNIIAGRRIVPELIQGDMSPERIGLEAVRILEEPGERRRIGDDLGEVRRKLGEPGASRRVAEMAIRMIHER